MKTESKYDTQGRLKNKPEPITTTLAELAVFNAVTSIFHHLQKGRYRTTQFIFTMNSDGTNEDNYRYLIAKKLRNRYVEAEGHALPPCLRDHLLNCLSSWYLITKQRNLERYIFTVHSDGTHRFESATYTADEPTYQDITRQVHFVINQSEAKRRAA